LHAAGETTTPSAAINRAESIRIFPNHNATNLVDVRLFGSEARGQATPESDIDVLVIVQPEGQRAALEDRAIDIAFDVNLKFGLYISPRVVTPGILNHPVWRETSFIWNVTTESIPL
jgi:predicted nucleotidyltransferase